MTLTRLLLAVPHVVLIFDLFKAEESQKKRRVQEGNDKGDPLHTPLLHQEVTDFFINLLYLWITSNSRICPCLSSALRPPVPPAFCPAFSSIVRLLCSDIIVHVLRRILQRAAEDRSTHWTEIMIQRVLTHSIFLPSSSILSAYIC